MKVLVRSHHLHLGIGLFIIFWITASLLPVRYVLLITNSLYLAGATAVGICYIPAVVRAIRRNEKASVQHIALGICYAWAFGALWRLWSLLWLTSGQQEWMVNNDLIAMFQAGIFLGACYHLTAPGAIAPEMPSLKWIALGITTGIGTLVAFWLIFMHPDTTWFVNGFKDYVPR